MTFDVVLLLLAGFFGGVLNSLAGGGSFITFPALIFVGVPPIMANATNTFSSFAGYLSGAFAFRRELSSHKKELVVIVLTSLLGGGLGAWLLLLAPEAVFQQAIPWLLLFATVLFIFGSRINQFVSRLSGKHKYASQFGAVLLFLVLLSICIYGGFFNAGLGIIALSYLALAGHSDINAMNGLKLMISSSVSFIAIILFIYNDAIAWFEGGVVLIGTLIGGYMSAHISKRISQRHIRIFVIVMSCAITLYFFVAT
ncbi:sulfite exporter TauE/SafE family protein [Shewanella olleyana]|uniref:sulfite exporter TauE/SafE family protein n=1 Tax=Shewanella olleyana TaxID=135626 RepID=UPI00200CADDA|nr:sulfite exporter TauE/SafE family protein [Shewanella olleyana]MCL1066457.1 sulfite exporter TauE/SafE family protein [Shewanella olleyana]